MTIQEIKAKIARRDIESKSVFVQTTLVHNPLRLVAIGRKFITVLSQGNYRRIDPIIVSAIQI